MADKKDLKVRKRAVEKAKKTAEEQSREQQLEAAQRRAEQRQKAAEKKEKAAEKAAEKAEKAAEKAQKIQEREQQTQRQQQQTRPTGQRSSAAPSAPARRPRGPASSTPASSLTPKSKERIINMDQLSHEDSNVLEMAPPKKKRRRGHNTRRTLVRLLLIALLVAGIVMVWKNWDVIAPDELLIWIDEQFTGGSRGAGYPVSMSGELVSTVQSISGQTVVLSDSALEMYDARGGQTVSRAHTYAQPRLETAGKYALLMESGGTRLRLETRLKTEMELTVLDHIVTGAVSKNGDVAIVTDSSESYASAVTVYSREGVKKYQWLSSEWMVTDVAFSSDSNQMAIVGVSAQNGGMISTLMTFNLRNASEEPTKQTAADTMLCAVQYLSGGTVAAVGDNMVWVMKPGGTLNAQQKYSDRELIGYAFGESAVSAVIRTYGSQTGGELLTVKASGELAYRQAYQGVFRSITAYQSGFLMLTDAQLLSTGVTGFEKSRDVASDGRMVSTLDQHMLVLGLSSLAEYTWQ